MAEQFISYKDESKEQYGRTMDPEDAMCRDQLKLGCLQRITDATELIAKNYQQLITDRDNYKRWYEEEHREVCFLKHQIEELNKSLIIGLREYIKRLRTKRS